MTPELSINYKISPELHKALNDQMLAEFYSSYLYLAVSDSFNTYNVKGFAKFFDKQAKEEFKHGEKFLALLQRLRLKVSFRGVDPVKNNWDSIETILQQVIGHEKKISTSIHEIHELAKSGGAEVVCKLLRWFIVEQLEEETSVINLYDMYQSATKGQLGLIDMDRQLSEQSE